MHSHGSGPVRGRLGRYHGGQFECFIVLVHLSFLDQGKEMFIVYHVLIDVPCFHVLRRVTWEESGGEE